MVVYGNEMKLISKQNTIYEKHDYMQCVLCGRRMRFFGEVTSYADEYIQNCYFDPIKKIYMCLAHGFGDELAQNYSIW